MTSSDGNSIVRGQRVEQRPLCFWDKNMDQKQYGHQACIAHDFRGISVCHGGEGMALSVACELVLVAY